jgi:hypothetical protein
MITFEAWPKTPRLNKAGSMTITEKIDGTNACVVVMPVSYEEADVSDHDVVAFGTDEHGETQHYEVGAQSRNRLITPDSDNAGFAKWVHTHANQLVQLLGPGRHFGEWWGQGIQRRYDMDRKVFSLFNTNRWESVADQFRSLDIGLDVVPVLYKGSFDSTEIKDTLDNLAFNGSEATLPYDVKFDKPEGVIIYHHELRGKLKAFVENDDVPKGAQS